MQNNKPKMEWIKTSSLIPGKTELEFIPIEQNVEERFQVWDNAAKKFLKEGDIIQTTKGDFEISRFNSLKQLSEDEQKRFKRNSQYVRKVIVDGVIKFFPIGKMAEQQFQVVMNTVIQMKKNPLHFSYIISRQQPPTGFMTYSVRLGQEQPDDKLLEAMQITDIERTIINQVGEDKDLMAKSVDDKIQLLIKNNVKDYRAKDLVNLFLS